MAEIVIVADEDAAGEIAATAIADTVRRNPCAVLGLATGSTPLSTYRALARRVGTGELDMRTVSGFALDEYVGLDPQHPESYREVIRREVVVPLGLDPGSVGVPDGSLDGIETAGERYERAMSQTGGIDVQILGIGRTGHIGFNEPGSSLAGRTRVKTLTAQTRRDNARFFDDPDQVPVHCITQGVGTILDARHLILLAFGGEKARAVADAVEGPVSSRSPGSAIQLHPHATVIVDESAASSLEFADYYRAAWSQKPTWQGI